GQGQTSRRATDPSHRWRTRVTTGPRSPPDPGHRRTEIAGRDPGHPAADSRQLCATRKQSAPSRSEYGTQTRRSRPLGEIAFISTARASRPTRIHVPHWASPAGQEITAAPPRLSTMVAANAQSTTANALTI